MIQDGHPVAYWSRRLNKHEENYTTTELELLAIVDAIEHFHVYLHEKEFTVFTDHQANKTIIKTCKFGRLKNFAQKLSSYPLGKIIYRKGSSNTAADALSRCIPIDSSEVLFISTDDIKQHQSAEPESILQRFIKRNDVYQIKRKGIYKIYLPKSLVQKILFESHDQLGHIGINKMEKAISNNYWWSGMSDDIRNYVSSCHNCQLIKPVNHPCYGQLKPITTPAQPKQMISMDTIVLGKIAVMFI